MPKINTQRKTLKSNLDNNLLSSRVAMLAPPTFHVLVKPIGATCNLACKYCYYLSKTQLYPHSDFHMTDELLETYIKQLIESQRLPEVAISWQGGEPTIIGLDFFRRAVKYVDKYKKLHQNIIYSIQTNGTRLDDQWCAFFKEHNFLVGLSIDGPQKFHNVYRVNKQGQGSFDQVMQGWRCLQKHGVDFNILCTVNAANANYPLEVYHFFRDELDAKFIQFIPVVETINQNSSSSEKPTLVIADYSVKPKQYGNFLITIFDEWVQRDVGKVYVQMFDVALANWLNIPHGLCVFSKTCGLALALEHNGDLYSCDHFVKPEYLLGNIKEIPMIELVASSKQRKFGQNKKKNLPRYCQKCEVRFACHGGCPKNRIIKTPDGEPGLNYLCFAYKEFFQHIAKPMQLMANLLRSGHAASEIMQR